MIPVLLICHILNHLWLLCAFFFFFFGYPSSNIEAENFHICYFQPILRIVFKTHKPRTTPFFSLPGWGWYSALLCYHIHHLPITAACTLDGVRSVRIQKSVFICRVATDTKSLSCINSLFTEGDTFLHCFNLQVPNDIWCWASFHILIGCGCAYVYI